MQPETDPEIVKENLHATAAVYSAWLLEQMRVFQVVDRLAELFRGGSLPIGMGAAGDALWRYWRPGERLSEQERRRLYERVLGAGADEAGGPMPNREFLSLWLRFMVAVATYARQRDPAHLLRPPTPSNAALRRAARELAANASLHGYGVAHGAARLLAADVQAVLRLLGEAEIRAAFGAGDCWQVIEQVSAAHLGGARNLRRYRTQAEAGRVVFDWLAANAAALRWPSAASDDGPDNAALVEAVQAWLAASAADDAAAQAEAEPDWRRGPDLAALGRDLLERLGQTADDEAAAGHDCLAVLHGARGTGKTLAAHVLAQSLSLDLLRVDLAQVVSKYLGETERNLEALFQHAQRAGAILFFDEADALFGRRTGAQDAHDRYADVDLTRLLQRIAEHPGLVIVATHRPQLDDEAIVDAWRRKRVRRVPFPRPSR